MFDSVVYTVQVCLTLCTGKRLSSILNLISIRKSSGLDYLISLNDIAFAMPFYRVYPTKVYRDYVRVVNRLKEVGK